MIYIAICDDDYFICGQLETYLHKNKYLFGEEIDIEVFYSVEECIKFMQGEHSFDFLFIDIEFKTMNGLQMGAFIRYELQDYCMQIIYISAREIYALQLFDTQPLNFLTKPIDFQKLKKVIGTGMLLLKNKQKEFSFKDGHSIQKESIDNILYFEASNRQVILHKNNTNRLFYGTLREVFKQVEVYGFFYCHKSFIVNYEKIKEFRYDSLTMINGDQIRISQTYRTQVKQIQLFQEMERY